MCSLEYKDGARTIEINGFSSLSAALAHVEERGIDSYLLRMEK